MTEEKLRDIKIRYPHVSLEELQGVTMEDFNKMSISFLEASIKDYKDMLQDVFKNGKTWACSAEELEWYKGLLRDQKNELEIMHKETVLYQKYLREGLNPPFCYRNKNEGNNTTNS